MVALYILGHASWVAPLIEQWSSAAKDHRVQFFKASKKDASKKQELVDC